MRIAVMGSGGVGGYFGARPALAGFEVRFLARGAHLAAMRENGLHVESALGDVHVARPEATDDPRSAGPADIVLDDARRPGARQPARSPVVERGVARGKACAIPTPVNRAIHDVLAVYANGTPGR